jgi:hypothetical protein
MEPSGDQPNVDISTLASALGALGLGSVAGQYLAGGTHRGEARARVLRALSDLEHERWANDKPSEFIEATRELTTAALLARIPRDLIREYLTLAYAAWWASRNSWDLDDFAPQGVSSGPIPSELAEAVNVAARAVVAVTWTRGLVRRWEAGKARRQVRAATREITDTEILDAIDRARGVVLH